MEKFFLSLIRLGIGNAEKAPIPEQIDWNQLEDIATSQGLSAILVDGIEKLPEGQRPPKPVLLQWIGETLQAYEYRYELYRRTIAEMAAFYNDHDYRMMLLKGYACSMNWPKPEHRPCGDIDIWQFGQQKGADAVLAKEKGIEIDKSHHHHTVFYWGDIMVENHYDFINVYQHKSHVKMEKIFKELGQDDSHFVELYGEKVYLPSPNLHALFLIKHLMLHFVSSEMSFRQLLDWAFFVEKHGKDVDWDWVDNVLGQFGMIRMYNIINAICVEDLGFDASIFSQVQFEPVLKDKALEDILSATGVWEEPKGFLHRLIWRYRRWKGRSWKHKLCFQESMWSSFWSGVWAHILKPGTI